MVSYKMYLQLTNLLERLMYYQRCCYHVLDIMWSVMQCSKVVYMVYSFG
jgi:hypothetical protein